MALENEKYMLFTTFRRDGRAVSTPVWLVHLPEDEIAFYTSLESGKVKRLRHTPRVTLQACNARGKDLHGPRYEGQARVVTGAERDRIWAEARRKYGLQPLITKLIVPTLARLRGKRIEYADAGIVISGLVAT